MNLSDIEKMWEKDSRIDPDNLHTESQNIPSLHAKYHQLHNQFVQLKIQAKTKYDNVYLERHVYYSGKAEPEVYEKEPFPYKVRDKEAMDRYMRADDKVALAQQKLSVYEMIIKYLEDIIKCIHNRSYHINNSIEWHKFQGGF